MCTVDTFADNVPWAVAVHELLTGAWCHHLAADGSHGLPAAFSSGRPTLQQTQAQPQSGGSTAETASAAFASNAPLQQPGQDFRSAAVAPPQTKDKALAREGTDSQPLATGITSQGTDAADNPPFSTWGLGMLPPATVVLHCTIPAPPITKR